MREPGIEDATRRTRLANERTYLAWWRTGLTAFAVAVGIGRVAPDVSDVTKWPYEIVGGGFGVLGLLFLGIGYKRARDVEQALDRGDFAPLGVPLPLGLLILGVALALGTIAVLFIR